MNKDSARSFLSLFSGGGGLDLGLERAGWQCHFATDCDEDAVASLQKNQGCRIKGGKFAEHAVILQRDVRDLKAEEILSATGKAKGDIPVMVGGPPCQSWSSAGNQKGMEDPRGTLFRDFVRLADDCDCRIVLFENVRGMLTARGPEGEPGGALRLIRSTLWKHGFYSTVALMNAADYGVPQRRVRLFIVGFRDCAKPSFPQPTHHRSEPGDFAFGNRWEPLSNVLIPSERLREEEWIRPSQRMAERLDGILPGTGIKSAGKAETTRPGGHWGYMQGGFVADPDMPARTVTASSQQDWIRLEDESYRRLCPRECAAIQSFPKNWMFAGSKVSQYRQIGNAVAPTIAEKLAPMLEEALDGSPHVDSQFDPSILPQHLQAAVNYTKREEERNGASRRAAPAKQKCVARAI